ncbi:MAG TPA: PilN domain-containing protein, partial [Candidatus Omnitrophota bacterium]|nr:PilN domain-containing protein [Candidatus Omnitrophota bacterium]
GLKQFFTETAIPVKFIDTQKVLGKTTAYSSTLVKGFAAALFKNAPLKIKINLIGSRMKAARAAASAGSPLAFFEGVKIDLRFIFLGIVICAAVFGQGTMRTQATQQELDAIKNKRVKISSVVANDNFQELSSVSAKYKKKIAALDNLVKNQMYVTPLLSSIPRSLPKGVWLESFNLTQTRDVPLGLVLNGQVYLEDGEQEFESVNIFITNLKRDPVFSGYFKEINIDFIDRKTIHERSVAVFKITCKTSAEKK